MKSLAMTVLSLSWRLPPARRATTSLKITRNGSQPPRRDPPRTSPARVRVDTPFRADAPARVGGGLVTFEPGARTAWHTHPLGQTLIVTQGVGLVQRLGRAGAGDPARRRRLDPAGREALARRFPTNGMSHYAIAEQLDGKTVDWLEKVSDDAVPRALDRTQEKTLDDIDHKLARQHRAGHLRGSRHARSVHADASPGRTARRRAEAVRRRQSQARRSSPTTCCSAMCGPARACRRATAAWSRSARSSR